MSISRATAAPAALLLLLLVLLAPAKAHASCEVLLPGDGTAPDETSCGPLNPPPDTTTGGGSSSTNPPNIVLWASGYDVNPFDGKRGGIWISRFGGSDRRQLTRFENHNHDFEPHGLNLPDDHPSFSPDSRKIVFTSNRFDGTDWDIYVMNANGSAVTRINAAPGLDTEPVYSPDGTKIAFSTARFGGGLDIAVMNANGTNVHRVTTSSKEDIEPAWRPDGNKIAFARVFSDDEKDVFEINPDGTGERRITDVPGEDHDPTYSPDGQQLVITSERSPTSPPFGNVHKIRASDGADLGDLTGDLDFGAGDPFWSHDGSVIAFFKSAFPTLGPMELFVMSANGSGKFHVPGEASVNVHPAIGRAVDDDGDGTPNYLESGTVGRAKLSPRAVRAGRRAVLHFSWTHPRRWRRLDNIDLRLTYRGRVVVSVRHAVAKRSFALYDFARGAFGDAKPVGRGTLRARALTLDLRHSRLMNVSRKTLRLDLAVRFAGVAAGGTYGVRVQATDAGGGSQEERLGRLRVTR